MKALLDQQLARFDRRTRIVSAALLAVAALVTAALAVVHFGLPSVACGGAFVVGLGGHLAFDVVGYVAVFVFGTRAARVFAKCRHTHESAHSPLVLRLVQETNQWSDRASWLVTHDVPFEHRASYNMFLDYVDSQIPAHERHDWPRD